MMLGLRTVKLYLCLLLALSGHRSEGRCPNHSLNLVAFVPCYDDTSLEWSDSQCDVFVYSAAQLAADHINTHPSVLSNTTVEIRPLYGHETVLVLNALGRAREDEVHGVLVTQDYRLAELSTSLVTDKLQVPAVSYGINNLSVRSNLFYLTLPSDVYVKEAILALLGHFEWFKVGLLSSTEERFLKEYESFVGVFNTYITERTNGAISVAFTGTFANENHIQSSLVTIQQRDIRIVVGLFGEKDATRVLCKASKMGLTTPEHVWILPSYFDPNWWHNSDTNCTNSEMKNALESIMLVGPVKYPPFLLSNQTQTPLDFRFELLEKTHALFPSLPLSNLTSLLTYSKATNAYDAVWTIASVWSYLMDASLCDNDTKLMKEMEQALKVVSDFEYIHLWGACNPAVASIDETTQDYYGQVLVTQLHDGQECPVGVVWPTSDEEDSFVVMRDVDGHSCLRELHLSQWIHNFTQYSSTNCTLDFQWRDGHTSPPLSGFSLENSKIDKWEIAVAALLSFLVMVFIVTILILNFVWRNNKYIKGGSPRLSVIILVGLLLFPPIPVLAALVISANVYHISIPTGVDVLCWLILWLRSLGAVLVFSTLLVTNYRIYRIFHNKKLQAEDDGLSDTTLLVAVMLFTLIGIIILTAYTIAHPQKYQETFLRMNEGEYDYMFANITACSGSNPSVGSEAYLVALTAAVLFFAFQNMKIKNRFRLEGVATCLAVVIVAIFYLIYIVTIHVFLTGAYYYRTVFQLTAVFCIIIPPTAVLILFLPKFGLMYRDYRKKVHKKSEPEAEAESNRQEYYCRLCKQVARLKGELAEVEKRIQVIQSQEKCSKRVTPSEPVIFKRTGSHLWRVLWTKLQTKSQLSRNKRESRVPEEEGDKEEGESAEVIKERTREKGVRLRSFSEKS